MRLQYDRKVNVNASYNLIKVKTDFFLKAKLQIALINTKAIVGQVTASKLLRKSDKHFKSKV